MLDVYPRRTDSRKALRILKWDRGWWKSPKRRIIALCWDSSLVNVIALSLPFKLKIFPSPPAPAKCWWITGADTLVVAAEVGADITPPPSPPPPPIPLVQLNKQLRVLPRNSILIIDTPKRLYKTFIRYSRSRNSDVQGSRINVRRMCGSRPNGIRSGMDFRPWFEWRTWERKQKLKEFFRLAGPW